MLSFVQLGPGSQNLTFQEKEIFIYRSKNENKNKRKKIGKYQLQCTILVTESWIINLKILKCKVGKSSLPGLSPRCNFYCHDLK